MEILQILQETVNMVISVKTLDNTIYKGTVIEIDDYLNVFLKNVDIFSNSVSYCSEILIRGSKIKCFILPEILKHLKETTE